MVTNSGDTGNDRSVVYVIDDDASVRLALEDLLASARLCVQSFASTREFLDDVHLDAPACLVLDVRMPGQSGLDFQREMAGLGLRMPVIFITGHGDIAMSVRAMKAGALEFLPKPFRDQDLLDAIQQGIQRDRLRRREEAVLAELEERWFSLTDGEREVMERVVSGLLNKQIALELNISEITVKVRRHKVMHKMRAHSVPDLVRIADQLTRRAQ